VKSFKVLLFSAATGLALAACGGGDDSDQSILSAEPIIVGDIIVTPDPSGTSAVLSADTTIPVACAVIYGTDDSFGQLAVDADMEGGAHEDHGPLLTGLSPDTEYQYVLQGSDASGQIYRSDIRTFRTPTAAETGLGPNVAPAGTATASSEFSESFSAQRAIDGNLGTEWSSAGDGDDAWIEIDLGAPTVIGAVGFRTRQMSDGTAITDTFTVTIDSTRFGPFPTGPEPAVLDEPVTGTVVRFEAEQTTGGNTGASEIEIYASP